jgi:hypothetical protein
MQEIVERVEVTIPLKIRKNMTPQAMQYINEKIVMPGDRFYYGEDVEEIGEEG